MVVSSAVSGTAEQTGDSSVRIRDWRATRNLQWNWGGGRRWLEAWVFSSLSQGIWDLLVSLILINTNKLNWIRFWYKFRFLLRVDFKLRQDIRLWYSIKGTQDELGICWKLDCYSRNVQESWWTICSHVQFNNYLI